MKRQVKIITLIGILCFANQYVFAQISAGGAQFP